MKFYTVIRIKIDRNLIRLVRVEHMRITINDVVVCSGTESGISVLGSSLSLTVTLGRWCERLDSLLDGPVPDLGEHGSQAPPPRIEVMIDFSIDVNVRQLSREQLGVLARDVVKHMVEDERWSKQFAPYVKKIAQFDVDYFPRLIAEKELWVAEWDWGNKWKLMGDLQPNHHKCLDQEPLTVTDMFDPTRFTLDELSAALRCTAGLLTKYTWGDLRGHMEWSDIDELVSDVKASLPRLVKTNRIPGASSFLPLSHWQKEVTDGRTQLGYEDWLSEQLSQAQRT